jgi:hypothetical protein
MLYREIYCRKINKKLIKIDAFIQLFIIPIFRRVIDFKRQIHPGDSELPDGDVLHRALRLVREHGSQECAGSDGRRIEHPMACHEFGCLRAPNFVDSESTSSFHNEVLYLT